MQDFFHPQYVKTCQHSILSSDWYVKSFALGLFPHASWVIEWHLFGVKASLTSQIIEKDRVPSLDRGASPEVASGKVNLEDPFLVSREDVIACHCCICWRWRIWDRQQSMADAMFHGVFYSWRILCCLQQARVIWLSRDRPLRVIWRWLSSCVKVQTAQSWCSLLFPTPSIRIWEGCLRVLQRHVKPCVLGPWGMFKTPNL